MSKAGSDLANPANPSSSPSASALVSGWRVVHGEKDARLGAQAVELFAALRQGDAARAGSICQASAGVADVKVHLELDPGAAPSAWPLHPALEHVQAPALLWAVAAAPAGSANVGLVHALLSVGAKAGELCTDRAARKSASLLRTAVDLNYWELAEALLRYLPRSALAELDERPLLDWSCGRDRKAIERIASHPFGPQPHEAVTALAAQLIGSKPDQAACAAALHMACRQGNWPVAQALLDATLLDLNAVASTFDSQGRTPLMSAVLDPLVGSVETARRIAPSKTVFLRHLLGRGPALDAGDSRGRTALHIAAMAGKTDAVATLLEYKASPFVRDAGGLRPVDVASSLATRQMLAAAMQGHIAASAGEDDEAPSCGAFAVGLMRGAACQTVTV